MGRFRGFVIFAEMRTGSNFLEAALNDLPDIACHGEAFNPAFVGNPKESRLFGMDIAAREADPLALLAQIFGGEDRLGGFRFFHDHDPRAFEQILPDPSIAKIILTRNPLESYISRKIAGETGQWKLHDLRHQKSAQVPFVLEEFQAMMARIDGFRARVIHGLQVTGQSAFHITYEQMFDLAVLNGLAQFLGSDHRLDAFPAKIKKQNPEPLDQKVRNPAQMRQDLAKLDVFGLEAERFFEPERGANVPSFVALPQNGLLFMPMRGGCSEAVIDWMAAIAGGRDALLRRMSQKDLRQWMRDQTGARAFAILQHPMPRAYDVFCRYILPKDRPHFANARRVLQKTYGLILPDGLPQWGASEQRAAFGQFLAFLKGNLSGQTSLNVDMAWATQTALLQGMAQVKFPDLLIRADDLPAALPALAQAQGVTPPKFQPAPAQDIALEAIYDPALEDLAFAAYRRDYIGFGFGPWRA